MTKERSLLSTPGRVLGWFATHPKATAGQAAVALGLTERTVLLAVHSLEAQEYLRQEWHGRSTWKLTTTVMAHHTSYILRLEQP